MVGSPAVMGAQLEQLSELPSVTLRVFPWSERPADGQQQVHHPQFLAAQPSVSDIVFIEGLTGGLYLEDPAAVET